MNKLALASVFSGLSLVSLGHAGGMGETGTGCAPSAFFSLEGGYAARSIKGLSLITPTTTFSPTKKTDNYSGRIAAGLIHMMEDDVGITGELGWGYYGSNTYSFNGTITGVAFSVSQRYTVTGFDVLIGGTYIQPSYSLFLKVGGMVQNMVKSFTPELYTSPISVYQSKDNSAQVLPAVKLGGGYNFDSNWSVFGSYMFVYGLNTKSTYSISSSAAITADLNSENPMINAIMFGVQYTI